MNIPQHWSSLGKLLHWIIAFLIFLLLAMGWLMDELPRSPFKVNVYALHKSLGLTVLILMAVRIAWRAFYKRPPMPEFMPTWQKSLASINHGLVYALLIAMPLSGWLYSSASNSQLKWFWIVPIPALIQPSSEARWLSHYAHENAPWILTICLVLHIGAALYHHFIYRDDALITMLPRLGKRAHEETPR